MNFDEILVETFSKHLQSHPKLNFVGQGDDQLYFSNQYRSLKSYDILKFLI